jgi:hypothetical protein
MPNNPNNLVVLARAQALALFDSEIDPVLNECREIR